MDSGEYDFKPDTGINLFLSESVSLLLMKIHIHRNDDNKE